jgi:hypothetical protein
MKDDIAQEQPEAAMQHTSRRAAGVRPLLAELEANPADLALSEQALTWSDPDTGLMWMCKSIPSRFNERDAPGIAASFNSHGGCDGHTDWRLPTAKELKRMATTGDLPECPFRAEMFLEQDDVFREIADAAINKRFSDRIFWASSRISFFPPSACLVTPLRGINNLGWKYEHGRAILVRDVP